MANVRLLERIANAKMSYQSAGAAQLLHQSIVDHVLKILQTSRETVLIRDDFGMPSYHDIQTFNNETNKALIADIAYQINSFEPRLHDLTIECKVSNEKGPLEVVFIISAYYENNDSSLPFKLQLTFNKRGQLKIKA